MAQAYVCDCCKKRITKNDIRINLHGYSVSHNLQNNKMGKGYGISFPEDFCSFDCLAKWANEQQLILNDYLEIVEKRYGKEKAELKGGAE